MFKDSFFKSSYKPKSISGDFTSKKDDKKKFSFTLPDYVKPTNTAGTSTPDKTEADSLAPPTGSQIKSRLKSVLSKKYGGLDTKNLFDDIDDKEVENNISTAESAIKANIDKGFLNTDYFKKFPNLRDGLALSYAAADKGNSKEAKKAREAAYFEQDEPLVKETGKRLLYNNLPKKTFADAENATKKESELPEASLFSNRSKENVPENGVRFKAEAEKSNKSSNAYEPLLKDSLPPPLKNSMAAEMQRREMEKNNHIISPSAIKSNKNLSGDWKQKDYSITNQSGELLSPSQETLQFLEDYFSDNYNVGETTVDFVINDVQLEALHKYLTDGVKNTKRPANIGIGAWDKQTQTDLKWIDDMFGKGSNFAKALKALPAITIGIDTIRGANENIKNNAGWGETVSDVVVDIGVGGLEVGTAAALTAGATYLIPTLAGGLPGLIASVVAGLAASYLWDYEKYGGDKTIKERLDSLF